MTIIRRNEALIEEVKARFLAEQRETRVGEVNQAIGKVREQFITSIPGQELIYNAKEEEARRYLALEEPPTNMSGFPFLAAETGVLAPTATLVAQTWIGMGIYWREVAASLEGLRMQSINAIRLAPSVSVMDQIVSDLREGLKAYMDAGAAV
jgi:hypothetical protein